MKKVFAIISLLLLLITALGVGGYFYYQKISNRTDALLSQSRAVEQQCLSALPLYSDYTTPAREAALRKYLLSYHLDLVKRAKVKAVASTKEIASMEKDGALVPVQGGASSPFYFYNVRREYRYLTPEAREGVLMVAARFQEILNRDAAIPTVKLALTSLLRPLDYQKSLRRRNPNASLVSSHSFGMSFDIFFDDFFVVLPQPEISLPGSENIISPLRRRLGFLLGDSLRRQFRAALAEALVTLQDEGKIYAILERRQRCYHVTVRPGE